MTDEMIGKKATDFKLPDHKGQKIELSSFKGKKVLLSFHPMAWTGLCAEQMKSLENNYSRFEDLKTIPLGISIDTVPSKNAWAKNLNIENVSLLSDFWPHGDLAKDMGIFIEDDGVSKRVNIIVDEKGIVRWSKVYEMSELPDIEEVLRALEDI